MTRLNACVALITVVNLFIFACMEEFINIKLSCIYRWLGAKNWGAAKEKTTEEKLYIGMHIPCACLI